MMLQSDGITITEDKYPDTMHMTIATPVEYRAGCFANKSAPEPMTFAPADKDTAITVPILRL